MAYERGEGYASAALLAHYGILPLNAYRLFGKVRWATAWHQVARNYANVLARPNRSHGIKLDATTSPGSLLGSPWTLGVDIQREHPRGSLDLARYVFEAICENSLDKKSRGEQAKERDVRIYTGNARRKASKLPGDGWSVCREREVELPVPNLEPRSYSRRKWRSTSSIFSISFLFF